jgi:hypothetical protein
LFGKIQHLEIGNIDNFITSKREVKMWQHCWLYDYMTTVLVTKLLVIFTAASKV